MTKVCIICTDRDTNTVTAPEMLQANNIYTAIRHCTQLSLHEETSKICGA